MKTTADTNRTSMALIIFVLIALLGIWEAVGRGRVGIAFFFSYPSAVISDLIVALVRDALWLDCVYTLIPAVAGIAMATLVGGGLGFALVAYPRMARPLSSIIALLAAFPVFAIAPMTLIWFGLGLEGKVFLAFISAVFVFLQASYNGGLSVPSYIVSHMEVHGFTIYQQFVKIRFPYAMDWLLASFKTGANLALLGVFVGEFVASDRGLARVMLNAGALYNVKRVLAAGVCFALLAFMLMVLANVLYAHRQPLLRWLSVPGRVRGR